MPLEAIDLYVHLKSGRTIHVTETWNGVEPTDEGMVDGSGAIVGTDGKEVSPPYRNIFRTPLTVEASVNTSQYVRATGVLPGFGTFPAHYTDERTNTPQEVTGDINPTLSVESDEVAGTKPRQYFQVYTWLVFTDLDGRPYKYRKADVLGWGSKAPLD